MNLEQATKTSRFKNEEQRALINVLYTGYWVQARWNKIFTSHQVSHAQYNVLRILRGQKGNPLSLKEVKGRMLEKNSNVTRLVEKLRIKGYIDRVENAQNRRAVQITITDAGMKLVAELELPLEKDMENMFQNLSTEEAIVLDKILNKLRTTN